MNSRTVNISFISGFCIIFCLGIVAGAYINASLRAVYLFTFLFFILSFLSRKRGANFELCVLLLSFFLGASLIKNSQILPACHISRITPYKSSRVSLKGVVNSDPVIKSERATFVLKAQELLQGNSAYKLCGKVQVTVFDRGDFSYGQQLILTGSLYKPPKRMRYRDYLKQQGIYSLLSVKNSSDIRYLKNNQACPVQGFAFSLKHKIERIIGRNVSKVPASVLEAMLLGERKDIPASINQSMISTGTVHILVVSGFNVGIVAFIVLLFLKALGMKRNTRYVITMIVLILYCLMTGASVPVLRATIMALVILFGYLLKREANIYNSLSVAVMIILFFNPKQLFNIGFQLSFASVLGIICLYPKVYALFPDNARKIKSINWLIQVFSVSLSAWAGTAGLIAYYFQAVSPVGILANMVIAPYASLITASGLAFVLVSFIIRPLSFVFGQAAELFVIILLKINMFFASIPGGYFKISHFNLLCVLLYYSGILVFVLLYRRWYNEESDERKNINS